MKLQRIAVVSLALFLGAAAAQAAEARKRVALMDFDFGTVQRWWSGNWDIGKGIADLVVTNLVKDGTYSVIERKRLEAILAEQNFSNSDRANPTTAAKIGKVLGINAIVVGTITQFGFDDKSTKVGGFGGTFGRLTGGGIGKKEGKATVVVDARLIDVNTAEILAVASGKGSSKRSGMLVGGASGGAGGGVDMSSGNFQETIIGEATRAAVEELTAQLIAQAAKVEATKVSVNGLIADASEGAIILNVGKSSGVSVGMRLLVERVGREVKDPATGKVIRRITSPVGEIEVTEADEGSAVAKAVSGQGFKVGDAVKTKD